MINLYIMRINLEFSCPRNRRNLSNIFASKTRQKRVYLLALGAFPINSIVLYVLLFILHAFTFNNLCITICCPSFNSQWLVDSRRAHAHHCACFVAHHPTEIGAETPRCVAWGRAIAATATFQENLPTMSLTPLQSQDATAALTQRCGRIRTKKKRLLYLLAVIHLL